MSAPLKVRNQANEVFAKIYSLLLLKARSALEFHAGRGGPGGWTPQPTVQVLSIPYLHPGAAPPCGSLGWGISSSTSLGAGCTGRKPHVDPESRPGLFGKEHPVGLCVWIFGARCRGKAPGGHIPVAPERV